MASEADTQQCNAKSYANKNYAKNYAKNRAKKNTIWYEVSIRNAGAFFFTNKALIKSILVFLAAIVAVWKIATLGVAEWYEQRIFDNDNAVTNSLAWGPNQPSVLFRASQIKLISSKDKNSQLLKRSLNGNPSDGRVLLALGNIWLDQNKVSLADKAVQQATKSLPSDAFTHIEASSYWLRRNNLDNAIMSWNVALQTSPHLKSQIFPILLRWFEEKIVTQSLTRVFLHAPSWWQEFFQYAALNASKISILDRLYELRRQSPIKISQIERNAYVNRLKREKRWSAAFLAWLNGLGESGLKFMGQPYNGNFEAPLTQSGFGWNLHKVDGVVVKTEHTFGNMGQRALHLVFQGKNIPYTHFSQSLFLAPARYRLSGLVRPDSLVTTGGLKWRLRCLSASGDFLGESERFLGVGQWQRYEFEFQVHANQCEVQDLRLESQVKNRGDAIVLGGIWFDSILIERIDEKASTPTTLY